MSWRGGPRLASGLFRGHRRLSATKALFIEALCGRLVDDSRWGQAMFGLILDDCVPSDGTEEHPPYLIARHSQTTGSQPLVHMGHVTA